MSADGDIQKAADGEGFNYLLNPQLSGVIVTTYSGTHSNFTIERAGTEMK
jgi:hypothetical protein